MYNTMTNEIENEQKEQFESYINLSIWNMKEKKYTLERDTDVLNIHGLSDEEIKAFGKRIRKEPRFEKRDETCDAFKVLTFTVGKLEINVFTAEPYGEI